MRYTLRFYDEDIHLPVLDWTYDRFREWYYGSTMDEETFYVDNSWIYFVGISDNDFTYAFLPGQHGAAVEMWTPSVYVSNVWNHAMGTQDTNPSLGKISHPQLW